MPVNFQVVDLFAGPGGLAEGFSSMTVDDHRPFKIALSVEKESSAFTTLRLRSFFRQFGGAAPTEYYDYLAGRLNKDQMIERYPEEWDAACDETLQAELGTPAAEIEINQRLDAIKASRNDRAILVGGPPCQAYSLVGRARNKGVAGYVPSEDHRHFLYREYIRILDRLNPAAFIMENVKGMLSSSVAGSSIFAQILDDLKHAGGSDERYIILSLTPASAQGYVLRAEEHGIPQTRHRVILLGIRSDLIGRLPPEIRLTKRNYLPTVCDAIHALPAIRSGLSKGDSDTAWMAAVRDAFTSAADAAASHGLVVVSERLKKLAKEPRKLSRLSSEPRRRGSNDELDQWYQDPALKQLQNHYGRGHMPGDLARYAFAAVFADVEKRSAKAADFPVQLAPAHKNWKSGKFSDRFRVQRWDAPGSTVTSHIAKDGHYFIHPDPSQCRSLTVREAARIQTFPDNYFFEGNRTQQYVQVGNAVPPLLARQIAEVVYHALVNAIEDSPAEHGLSQAGLAA